MGLVLRLYVRIISWPRVKAMIGSADKENRA